MVSLMHLKKILAVAVFALYGISLAMQDSKEQKRTTTRIKLDDATKNSIAHMMLSPAKLAQIMVYDPTKGAFVVASTCMTGKKRFETQAKAEKAGFYFSPDNKFKKYEIAAVHRKDGGYVLGLYLGHKVVGYCGDEVVPDMHVFQVAGNAAKTATRDVIGKYKQQQLEIPAQPHKKLKEKRDSKKHSHHSTTYQQQ